MPFKPIQTKVYILTMFYSYTTASNESSEESLPPLSNRDPNYLTNHELVTSPWLEFLTLSRRSLLMATKLHSQQRSLHCDIHGMKDSTVKDVDVIFGLKAMELVIIKFLFVNRVQLLL